MTEIIPARPEHVPAMVALSHQKRAAYAAYQPHFWRMAEGADAAQTPYFYELLTRENLVVRVALAGETVVGFVMAAVIPAPAVYDPGGLTCMIDDFCVADPALWATVGRDLLAAATAAAKARGAVQAVVVCGHLDQPKRAALAAAGLTIASEWYTGPIE